MERSIGEFLKLLAAHHPEKVIVDEAWFGVVWNLCAPHARYLPGYKTGQAVKYFGTIVVNADFKEPNGVLDLTGEAPRMHPVVARACQHDRFHIKGNEPVGFSTCDTCGEKIPLPAALNRLIDRMQDVLKAIEASEKIGGTE